MSSYEKTHVIRPPDKPASRGELLRWAGWFFLVNSFIALLLSLHYLSVVEFPDGDYTTTFSILAFIGHFASLSFFATAILFLPIIFLPRKNIIFVLGIIVALGDERNEPFLQKIKQPY